MAGTKNQNSEIDLYAYVCVGWGGGNGSDLTKFNTTTQTTVLSYIFYFLNDFFFLGGGHILFKRVGWSKQIVLL